MIEVFSDKWNLYIYVYRSRPCYIHISLLVKNVKLTVYILSNLIKETNKYTDCYKPNCFINLTFERKYDPLLYMEIYFTNKINL